jgi:tetratricopeptide (TPR) repeat protein
VTTGVDERYPRRLGPFALVTPLLESGGVALSPALRRRGLRPERCLVTHLRLGGKHAALLDRRFRRGSELGRRLRHGAIAATLAVGRIGDRLFVAHEFLAGVHLGRVPAREMDVATAAFIAAELTRALGHLHAFEDRRLVHHGVTPINIHLGWDGRVKLLECGLALSSRHPDAEGEDAPRSFRGGARYVAPEVRAGAPGDARSDVYSVGVVLWELLAGRTFEDDRALGATGQPGRKGPALRDDETTDRRAEDTRSGPRAPAGLYAVVAKAMSPDPLRRHSDAQELGEALADFAPGRLGGRLSVRRLLARLFDVAGSRQRVEQGLLAARPLLDQPDEQPVESLTPAPVVVNPRRSPRTLLRVGGLLALGGLALVAEKRFAPQLPPGQKDPPAVTVALEREKVAPPAPPEAEAPAPPPSEPPPPRRRPRVAVATAPMVQAAARPRLPAPRTQDEAEARALDALKSAEERFQWGDLEGAERLARAAAGKLARNARAFYFLGVVLLARGEASDAGSAFERVLELDPVYPDAAAKLRLAHEKARALGRANEGGRTSPL